MVKAKTSISRWHVTSRVFAAILFGFILTNTNGVMLTFLLPGDKLSGITTSALLSWTIYAAIVLWVFAVERLRTVWLGLTGAIVSTSLLSVALFFMEKHS
ncbi:MAG: hypothetical protein AAF465_10535 [Pseudomonadota bacterium]